MADSDFKPTDYPWLRDRVEQCIAECAHVSFDDCVVLLLDLMRNEFPALTERSNPVSARLNSWTREELGFLIKEYSGFSNAAIHMFLEARIRNHWPSLTAEIVRNMEEEMGALCEGIPHLELMRDGYRMDLGLETDGLRYAAVTEDFIDRMNGLFRIRNNTVLAGALLAFEATAVDEFHVVDRMLRRYKALSGGQIAPDSLTGRYIAGHVAPEAEDLEADPELAHYRGMVEAIRKNVDLFALDSLARGFVSICLELNRWWEHVATEAIQNVIRGRLEPQTDRQPMYS
ncbi:DUF3865 domain-containing protein [Paraburkholderia hospita]|uniref:DUF3865 domain-containing protein n=1 Tax=Paraburkholderia hospita TaxID=169430 RepID=UPI0008A7EF08|nr:DUF3865 domain-containing protein [Paraburkholderia hospita]SEI14836.1 protein of unknown function [Paraburkholderia hospita]